MTATVQLADVALGEHVAAVRDRMRARFGRGIDRRFTRDVFARQAHVLDMLDGGSVLDVGAGQGIFLNAAALSGRFDRLVGIDIASYDHYVHMGGWEHRHLDVVDLDYPDRSFDTVTAMEIIEHLPDGKMEAAVEQLQRVARRVIVTVPYREHPLPSYHQQRFDEDRLAGLFPAATLTVLAKQRRRQTPWVLADWQAS